MDAYPDDYVVHNLPLILLSGLQKDDNDVAQGDRSRTLLQEGGFRINSELPPITTETSAQVLRCLLRHDMSNAPWNSRRAARSENRFVFRIRSIGRKYSLPPRKAPPPPHSPRLRPSDRDVTPPPPMILHSMLSPLTPSSPLYADGLMTPLWITKHQSRLPSVFVTFFALSSDTSTSTLLDNKIKNEINNIKSVFTSANYKTKVVVVLLGDEQLSATDADDRVNSIKRAIALDTKSLFFLPAIATSLEVADFAKLFLTTLYPASVEYYRDLSKHARRKRSRSTAPQPTIAPTSGISKILHIQGWTVRYEFKLGVFAEFRQEMDAAVRNYEAAYESLFTTDVFETIPSWSPRFSEARMLSDTIALRIIRCLLWNGQTTNAVRRWSSHRVRIRDAVARRGAGTDTYGWEAWQSTWCHVMVDLVQRTEVLPQSNTEGESSPEKSILVHSEKTLASMERFAPFESLHHEGYWLYLAQQHTQSRRSRALQMPEEDRIAPGRSPASAIASKAHLYDRYLTLEPHRELPADGSPGFDYSASIIQDLGTAVQHFSNHSQIRMIQLLQLQIALELVRIESWQEAQLILVELWHDPMLRNGGWWILLDEIGRALRVCAKRTSDDVILKQMEWEYSNPTMITGKPGASEQIESPAISELDQSSTTPLQMHERLTRITPKFAFAAAEGHVGKPMDLQLSLHDLAPPHSSRVHILRVEVVFEGKQRPICLIESERDGLLQEVDEARVQIVDVSLSNSDAQFVPMAGQSTAPVSDSLCADVNLAMPTGGVSIYQLGITPREAGEMAVSSIAMMVRHGSRLFTLVADQAEIASEYWWEARQGVPSPRLCGRQRLVSSALILPKPPKIEIGIPQLRQAYFTNEEVVWHIEVVNHEDETVVSATVEINFVSLGKIPAAVHWEDRAEAAQAGDQMKPEHDQVLPPRKLPDLIVGQRTTVSLVIGGLEEAADHEAEIIVSYSLSSHPETILHKAITVDLPVIRPFEANFGFHSRKHSDDWPSFFSSDSITQNSSVATGLKQQYLVSTLIGSFSTEDIEIESVQLTARKVVGQAICSTGTGILQHHTEMQHGTNQDQTAVILAPSATAQFSFDMMLQKHTLGDRQPLAVDFHMDITWRRVDLDTPADSSKRSYVSRLQVPRFLAPSSEPRVLLHVASQTLPAQHNLVLADPVMKNHLLSMYTLTYTIENPSLHFLTFTTTMETSEEFAFSGAKVNSLSLVPISRHDLAFRLMPNHAKIAANGTKSTGLTKEAEGTTVEGATGAALWMRVNLEVVDAYFGQTLKVQPASEGVRVDKAGNVLVRIV